MMASMRVTAFTNTFLVSNNGDGGPVLKVVGPQEARKKRPHRVCLSISESNQHA